MKNVLYGAFNFFKPKHQNLTGKDKIIARVSMALAIVLLLFPMLTRVAFAEDKFGFLDDWCETIVEGSGAELVGIFNANDKTDTVYADIFQFCTGITGNIYDMATGENRLGITYNPERRDANYKEKLITLWKESERVGDDLKIYWIDTVFNRTTLEKYDRSKWRYATTENNVRQALEDASYNEVTTMLKYTGQSGVIRTIYSEANVEMATQGKANNIMDYFRVFVTALKAVGAIFFMIRLVGAAWQAIVSGRDKVEELLDTFIKMCLGLAIILNADKLVTAVCYVGFFLGTKLNASIASSGASAQDLYDSLKLGSGALNKLIGVINLIIPYAISFLLNLATNFMILSTLFEIGILRLFVPLAVCDVYNNGLQSSGIRYIKKLLAGILKLVIALVVIILSNAFLGRLGGNGIHVASILIMKVTTLGLISKGGDYANSILGMS